MLALDMHAHIQPDIDPQELEILRACVIAVTRSLAEYQQVIGRDDSNVAWGVGCHPALARSISLFDMTAFRHAIFQSPVVAEIGLDGSSRVPLDDQWAVLDQVLAVLAESPRLTSIHSFRATAEVLNLIAQHQPQGLILHWWLGTAEETVRAVEVGAYFSVNSSQAHRWPYLSCVPRDRVLLETDHPYGDRRSTPQRPGNVVDAESRLARTMGVTSIELRHQSWRNLRDLLSRMPDVASMLPREFQVQLLAAG